MYDQISMKTTFQGQPTIKLTEQEVKNYSSAPPDSDDFFKLKDHYFHEYLLKK